MKPPPIYDDLAPRLRLADMERTHCYLTGEEWETVKAQIPKRSTDESHWTAFGLAPTVWESFLGIPLAVDHEKALLQQARVDEAAGHKVWWEKGR